jgi:hypothetical protein
MALPEVIYFRTSKGIRKLLEQTAEREARSVPNLVHYIVKTWAESRNAPARELVDPGREYVTEKEPA